ncbi:MAG: large conductance mechanosensitive channel protein MscL [Clostridia bacterium]|nr:large conductance mechanosensitive channel protein MscL [Clostridia bacterium]
MGKADLEHLQARIEAGEEAERKEKQNKMKKELKAKKDGFFKDFKKFITRGNVLDMAVGVIVGGAFTAIINALSNNILKPVINWILALIIGTDSLSEVFTYLKVVKAADGTIDLTQSIYIDWGAFINAIINFLLIAFTLFMIVRIINNVRKRLDAKEIAEAAAKAKAEEEKKKAADAAKAEAEAAAAKAQADALAAFYANVEKQTKLLEEIAKK